MTASAEITMAVVSAIPRIAALLSGNGLTITTTGAAAAVVVVFAAAEKGGGGGYPPAAYRQPMHGEGRDAGSGACHDESRSSRATRANPPSLPHAAVYEFCTM